MPKPELHVKSSILQNGCLISVILDDERIRPLAKLVRDIFAKYVGPLTVEVHDNVAPRPTSKLKTSSAQLLKHVGKVRQTSKCAADDFVILLTTSTNELNRTSLNNQFNAPRDAFITVNGMVWETITPTPVEYVVAYEVITNIFACALDECGIPRENVLHSDPIGCIADWGPRWSDASIKLRTGDICGDCITLLESHGASTALLFQVSDILGICRQSSIAMGRYSRSLNLHFRWPFPIASTWHRYQTATSSKSKLFLMLDHYDATVRHIAIASSCRDQTQLDLPEAPSLGWWSRTMQNIKRIGEFVDFSEQKAIVDCRNDLRGHGYVSPNPGVYIEGLAKAEEGLADLHHYFNVRESDWSIRTVERLCHEASDQLIISCKNLTGCNPEFSTYELPMESATSLPRIGTKGSPAIHLFNERDGRWVDLHDLYRLETCPNCNDTRLLVIDGKRGPDTTRYIDIRAGHRVNLSSANQKLRRA